MIYVIVLTFPCLALAVAVAGLLAVFVLTR